MMPRATYFSRSEVERRGTDALVDCDLLKRLSLKAPIPDQAREMLKYELRDTVWHYRTLIIARNQERPARNVAALKRGLGSSKRLLESLNSLPPSLRMELRAGGVEQFLEDLKVLIKELVAGAQSRSAYWQTHVVQHRPSGESDVGTWLRQDLTAIIAKHSAAAEPIRRRWVADVAKAIGAKYPHEKKNKKRFLGEQLGKDKRRRTTRAKRPRQTTRKPALSLA
jgi:hypothetical protein